MSKLWLIGLAASAAWTLPAMAQPAPPAPPPPPMAHGMHAPMPAPGAPMIHHPMPKPGHMPGHMPGMHRIGRGGMLPPFFMGPQFIVHDWRMFGFPQPMPGGHWVRYYDDALLVDRDGRVMDGRYGWDWDRRGHDDDDRGHHGDEDEWADDGPDMRHHGDRDMRHHGDRDVRHHGGRERTVKVYRHGGRGDGDCRRRCRIVRHVPPPPPPHYGYGYGYGGYGYGCGCGGVVITETTTTTAPVVETRTYYETVVERPAPRRHYSKPVVRHYSKPVVRRSVKAAPAPRPGERG